ncbi:hypothetical protein GC163_20645 [bacterium]|nr:hypothetical protein [bacterium]
MVLVVSSLWLGLVTAEERSAAGNQMALKPPTIPGNITGVLREINQELSRDLQPSENAVVILVQLFGTDVFEQPLRETSLTMLGIEDVSSRGPRLTYIEPFLRGQKSIAPAELTSTIGRLEQHLAMAGEKPWPTLDDPLLHEYLESNREALDAFVTASNLPRYFAPLLSPDAPPRLLSVSLVIERRLPYLVHCLAARGMSRWQAGQHDAALEDLLACHRWAVLLASGSPFDVSLIKAQNLNTIGYRAAFGLLESGALNGEQARNYLQRLSHIPPMPTAAMIADQGERAILHQELEFFRTDADSVRDFFENTNPEAADIEQIWKEDIPRIKWDLALQRANQIQDEYVHALGEANSQKQLQQFQKLEERFEAWNQTVDARTKQFSESLNTNIEDASRWIGESMAFSLKPWFWQRRLMERQARVRQDFTVIGLSLVAYRDTHGKYPERLSELAPSPLSMLPVDPHSGQPYHYKRSANGGALLTSWGANLLDHAGQQFNDDLSLQFAPIAGKEQETRSK